MRTVSSAVALAVVCLGCASAGRSTSEPSEASAELRDASGKVVGTADFADHRDGVIVVLRVEGLPAGPKGVHVHEKGSCEPPDFESAGAHFNPKGKQHGSQNPEGPHAGDLPNIDIEDDGDGRLESRLDGVPLADGDDAVLDPDGAAIVIHAGPDDYKTDPSGNSGDRIVCGVIKPGSRSGY